MKSLSLKNRVIEFPYPMIMGILNISPESFSGDGKTLDDVVARAIQMEQEGADIIDVGACSTAPHNPLICEREELSRIGGVLKAITSAVSVPVSVDTFRSSVAELSIELGAQIINDVSGVVTRQMANVIKSSGVAWVITHNKSVSVDNAVSNVKNDLLSLAQEAASLGVKPEKICLDPGIGFNKQNDVSAAMIKGTKELSDTPFAYLVGLSRKRVVGELSGIDDPKGRDIPSLALDVYCAQQGADIIRVHNVDMTAKAFKTLKNLGEL